MDKLLASSLSEYHIMTTEGAEIGKLENITFDPKTGHLEHLRVDPFEEAETDFPQTEEGKLQIPAEAVSAVNDYLLVEPMDSL
jgi:sporulation protein YlmC with PRC-barrel domain